MIGEPENTPPHGRQASPKREVTAICLSPIRNALSRVWAERLSQAAPGLPELTAYRRSDFAGDLIAGLSVAAVAVPVGVAYAQLAGFRPETGLYASILPPAAYALFGTSRQLIVGPDAATCALVAAAVGPLAGGNDDLRVSLSATLAFLAGVFCILAKFLKLGGLADFLSKPILVGFMNGMALSIALGQLGKIFGFSITRDGIIPRLAEFVSKLGSTHLPTLLTGAAAFAVIALAPRVTSRVPAALAAMAVTGTAVWLFRLDTAGVSTIGAVAAGLPGIRIPSFPVEFLPNLCAEAAGVALIGFSSMMLTARSFASKNGYEIDVDREFAALGAANIAAGISQSFAVSGADSRTAMSDAAGGRTRVTGLIAAAAVAVALLFFTSPLQHVPTAALGVVLVKAAFSLLDVKALKTFYELDRRELALSLVATIGVATVGPLKAILLVVIMAILRFVRLVSRPQTEVLGTAGGTLPHPDSGQQETAALSGLLLFRFNAPIVFFNAPFFKRTVLEAAASAGPHLKWFVMDMIPVTIVDITGLQTLSDVIESLRARDVAFVAAGRERQWKSWAKGQRLRSGGRSFPTFRAALKAYKREHPPPSGLDNSSETRP